MKKKNYLQPQTKAKAIDGECTMQNGSPSEPMPLIPKMVRKMRLPAKANSTRRTGSSNVLCGTTRSVSFHAEKINKYEEVRVFSNK